MSNGEIESFDKYFNLINKNSNLDNAESDTDNKSESSIDSEDKFALKKLRSEIKKLENEKKELYLKIKEVEGLLNQPMSIIAKHNSCFKVNYDNLMLEYALDLVLQKAYKELSIQFGKNLGVKSEEVIKLAQLKEIGVIENKHNPAHSTVANSSKIIVQRINEVKSVIYSKNMKK